jgi:hypothetical protein
LLVGELTLWLAKLGLAKLGLTKLGLTKLGLTKLGLLDSNVTINATEVVELRTGRADQSESNQQLHLSYPS